eukprot:CAMPEP_0117571304 /NCGR_PEP_ID=MMETSP0784-20121206/59673_1 /TAXON_ID=39447 /ORGANISM="" /LENGTH=50 /DNA_ID=CAMNT_0005369441 /DNA_START=57 /DNA_END=206 /DNA_ORIENTATION=-
MSARLYNTGSLDQPCAAAPPSATEGGDVTCSGRVLQTTTPAQGPSRLHSS